MELVLIIEAAEPARSTSIFLEGRSWTLSEPYGWKQPQELPEYTCVSYSWGSEQEQNPLDGAVSMSSRTLPALAAAIRAGKTNAFWTDVFCVPASGPRRQATLQSMGYIYGHATEVVVFLAPTSFQAVQEASQNKMISHEGLLALEREPWISSVWTYQEVVNCNDVCFASERQTSSSTIDGHDLFNLLGNSLTQWRKTNNVSQFEARIRMPHLDAFEDLIGDWMLAGFGQRSALLVMSAMDRRVSKDPKNRFYAMIGAVTQEPVEHFTDIAVHDDPCENFMTICEAENDYSFIYSAAERRRENRKHWRPVSGMLHSIVPWHCWGEAQRAYYNMEGDLVLEDVLSLVPSSSMSHQASQFIWEWLQDPGQKQPDGSIAEAFYSVISQAGFSGSSHYVTTKDGIFFPQISLIQTPVASDTGAPVPSSVQTDITILASTQIRYAFGSPALAIVPSIEGTLCIPGLLAGPVWENHHQATTVCLA